MEGELRDLKSKLLYGSGTAQHQVVQNLLYGSGTAELPSHSIFIVRKWNCVISEIQVSVYSLCGGGTAEIPAKVIPCAEVEPRNFKTNNSLCAEAELQIT